MNQRPALDASSFEKLLAAAWVLQCQRDRNWLRVTAVSILPVASGAVAPPASEEISIPPLADVTENDLPRNSTPPPRADLRTRIEFWKGDLFKIRITESSRRAAMAAFLPSLILVLVLAFALSQISGQGHELVAGISPPSHVLAETGNAKAVSTRTWIADAQAADATLPESHERITDADALALVDGLTGSEIRVLRWEAEGGDDSSALAMGMLYETGRYLPQSCRRAAEWVTRSANWGNAAAEYNLGLRYLQGDGVPVDERQAEQWMQKAGDQGYSQATAALKEKSLRGF